MDQICLVLPIKDGMTDDAREFMRELEQERKSEYDRSERRIGITKEAWYIAAIPTGDALVAYMETEDFPQTFSMFSGSREDFDMWFKRRLAETTGLDMNNPPPGMVLPELQSAYEVERAAVG
jgi:Family of unknown function (DUF6176)